MVKGRHSTLACLINTNHAQWCQLYVADSRIAEEPRLVGELHSGDDCDSFDKDNNLLYANINDQAVSTL